MNAIFFVTPEFISTHKTLTNSAVYFKKMILLSTFLQNRMKFVCRSWKRVICNYLRPARPAPIEASLVSLFDFFKGELTPTTPTVVVALRKDSLVAEEGFRFTLAILTKPRYKLLKKEMQAILVEGHSNVVHEFAKGAIVAHVKMLTCVDPNGLEYYVAIKQSQQKVLLSTILLPTNFDAEGIDRFTYSNLTTTSVTLAGRKTNIYAISEAVRDMINA